MQIPFLDSKFFLETIIVSTPAYFVSVMFFLSSVGFLSEARDCASTSVSELGRVSRDIQQNRPRVNSHLVAANF